MQSVVAQTTEKYFVLSLATNLHGYSSHLHATFLMNRNDL